MMHHLVLRPVDQVYHGLLRTRDALVLRVPFGVQGRLSSSARLSKLLRTEHVGQVSPVSVGE